MTGISSGSPLKARRFWSRTSRVGLGWLHRPHVGRVGASRLRRRVCALSGHSPTPIQRSHEGGTSGHQGMASGRLGNNYTTRRTRPCRMLRQEGHPPHHCERSQAISAVGAGTTCQVRCRTDVGYAGYGAAMSGTKGRIRVARVEPRRPARRIRLTDRDRADHRAPTHRLASPNHPCWREQRRRYARHPSCY